jgi:tRNA-modifying protein YgfZ
MSIPRSHVQAQLEQRGGRPGETFAITCRHFGDPLHEVSGSRRHAGFFEHRFHRSLVMEGAGAKKALHGQVTQDLLGLRPGQGAYACHLDRKGGLVSDLVVLIETEERLRLLLPAENQALMQTKLRPVAMLADCSLHAPGEEPSRFLLSGPAAFSRLSQLTEGALRLAPYEHRSTELEGGLAVRVLGWPETGDPGLLIECDPGDASRLLDLVLGDEEIVLGGEEAWDIMRVEGGFPVWGRDLGPGRLPPEAGLEHAISYTKGCYIGQETMARIRTYGRVNRQLVSLRADVTIPAGAELFAGERAVGAVTSALAKSSAGHPLALAYVRRAHVEPGTSLELRAPVAGEGQESKLKVEVGPRVTHPRRYEALPSEQRGESPD